ncbi:HNH endonuclease [Eubacteriales bacterium OttesenSCG-928-A19]|nr:HNH endonuclease [Eubacteriales bacterium OttesenSCG-928-A19]
MVWSKETMHMLIPCAQCGKLIQRKRSHLTGSSNSFCSRACSSAYRRTGLTVPCHWCGAPTYKAPSRLTEQNFCSARCRNRWMGQMNIEVRNVPGHTAGHKAPHLTDLNRRRNPLGRIGTNGKPASSKRYRRIAEQMLGRPLAKDEEVHHLNGDRCDNRPENLAVLPRSQHHRLHMYLACGRMESLQEGGDVKCQKKPPSPEA